MTVLKSHDPKYLINIEIGMDVMILEGNENKKDPIPCKVKKIISTDAIVEFGVKVECEDGQIGRVKFIGEEGEFRNPDELLTILEKKLRKLIEDVLSKTSKNWWQDRISESIQENIEL